jgi:hypothetical protein
VAKQNHSILFEQFPSTLFLETDILSSWRDSYEIVPVSSVCYCCSLFSLQFMLTAIGLAITVKIMNVPYDSNIISSLFQPHTMMLRANA